MGTAGAGLPKHMEMWARSPECLLPLCFPESCWAGAQAGQGLCAMAGPWLAAWAGDKTGVGAEWWGQTSGAFSQALLRGG